MPGSIDIPKAGWPTAACTAVRSALVRQVPCGFIEMPRPFACAYGATCMQREGENEHARQIGAPCRMVSVSFSLEELNF